VDHALPVAPGEAGSRPVLRGSLRETMLELEREVVLGVLEAQRWRMTAAAARLGIERSHLYKKLKSLGIERPD
jgi:DNA-binding NtrC family response regulator